MKWDWGESAREAGVSVDPLAAKHEAELVEELVRASLQLDQLIRAHGIPFPRCWLALEVPVRKACPSWPEAQPGDLDLVFGALNDEGSPDFRSVFGAEIKVRRTRADGSIGKLSSGRGTGQARLLAEMGFDSVVLTQ